MTQTEFLHQQMPFTLGLGFEVESAACDRVVLRGAWDPSRCTAGRVLHGGYLMALADAAGAACAVLNLPPGATTSTIESKTNFLRSVRNGDVTATSSPIHVGTTTIVVQTDLVRNDGRLVARTLSTQAVITTTSTTRSAR
jgi:uncharacterized protein (TIGR00369 family)